MVCMVDAFLKLLEKLNALGLEEIQAMVFFQYFGDGNDTTPS